MPSYSLSENAPTTPPGSAARVRRHCRSKDLPRSCRCQRIPKVSPLPEHGQEFGSLSGLYQGPHQAVVCRRCRSPEQHAMADGEGSEAEGSRRTEDVQEIGVDDSQVGFRPIPDTRERSHQSDSTTGSSPARLPVEGKTWHMAMPLYDVERFRLPTVEIASRHSLRLSHRV